MPDTPICPNCGAERPGQFCASCGQKDQPLRQRTSYFLRQAFNEYFGVDGRLWVTLKLLLFRPGRLTAEHLRGRRRRYLAPLRLYLSATLLFFLLSVLDPVASLERQLSDSLGDSTITVAERAADLRAEVERKLAVIAKARDDVDNAVATRDSLWTAFRADSLSGAIADSASMVAYRRLLRDSDRDVTDEQEAWRETRADEVLDRNRLEWQVSVLETYPPDSTIRPADLSDAAALLFPGGEGDIEISVFGDNVPKSTALQRLTVARTGSEKRDALADLARSAIDRLPLVMFLMLPLFALLMKLVYIRREWYYSEHLIFALHNHAVAFIGWAVMAILVAVAGDALWVELSNAGIMILLNVYFVVAQKHVYGQSWGKTLVKYVLVFAWYWGAVSIVGMSALVFLAAVVG